MIKNYSRKELHSFNVLITNELIKIDNTLDLIEYYCSEMQIYENKDRFSIRLLQLYKTELLRQLYSYNNMKIEELGNLEMEHVFSNKFNIIDVLRKDLYKRFINTLIK